MSFPERYWFGLKKGWSDRGLTGEWKEQDTPKDHFVFMKHALCGTQVRVGKEKGSAFLYCPKCEKKFDG